MTTVEQRARAESIVETIIATTQTGCGSPGGPEDAVACAQRLNVPVALIWLAADQMTVEQIDELVAWWPRRGA
jgi:hypothetical protein